MNSLEHAMKLNEELAEVAKRRPLTLEEHKARARAWAAVAEFYHLEARRAECRDELAQAVNAYRVVVTAAKSK